MTDETFGTQLILDMGKCNRERLVDEKFLSKLIDDLLKRLNMIAISEQKFIKYKDAWAKTPGYTGGVYIATSHIDFHTFPDSDYCFLDIFSCTHFDAKSIGEYIIKLFDSKDFAMNIIDRGKNFKR